MESLHRAFLDHLAPTSPDPLALDIVAAEGCYLIGRDGRRYLDLVAGLAVNNTGHRHPAVVSAIKEQCDRYLHVIPYGEFIQEPQVKYAEALAHHLPDALNSVYFVNSGAEAIEGSLKLAKRTTGRTRMVACHRSYHGSTHGALSVTGNEQKKYRNRPLLPDVHFMRFNSQEDIEMIGEDTAAVVVEPVQGDAGVRIPDPAWLRALREHCDRTGAMLIFDEVQTGFGRTGKLFAMEHSGVVPDILVLGKALGGGMPMGAFVASKERMHLLAYDPVLGHITTFGGHPLPCVAGHAALEIIQRERLVDNATRIGQLFSTLLEHPCVHEVRGIGAMLAVELGSSERAQRVVKGCIRKGVLGFWFLSCPTAFRIAPPLVMNEEQVRQACAVIRSELDVLDLPITEPDIQGRPGPNGS